MKKIDKAYKTGAGRYVQEPDALDTLASEVTDLGSSAFLVTGPNCKVVALPLCENSLSSAGVEYEVMEYAGPPSYEQADRIIEQAKNSGRDVLVGIGGGRVLDVVKSAAETAGFPIICVPTSIATCCAYTPLSVMYNEDGTSRGCHWLTHETDAVMVDHRVMKEQPARLVAAGVLDSIAKVPEISNGVADGEITDDNLQTFAAFEYAKTNNIVLFKYGFQAFTDAQRHEYTEALDKIVFTNIALTGVVSSIMRGFHQTALAHRFYNGCRTFLTEDVANYLHGELVSIGLLLQTTYNGNLKQRDEILNLMKKMDMPTSLSDLGILKNDERIKDVFNRVNDEEFVPRDATSQAKLKEAFNLTIE